MKLTDLHPEWFDPHFGEIAGITFDCPVCGNEDMMRGHQIGIPFSNPVSGGGTPYKVLWSRDGVEFGSLTLSPSIRSLRENCGFHGFVTAGDIVFCADSPKPASEMGKVSEAERRAVESITRKVEQPPEAIGMKIYNTEADAGQDLRHAVKIDKTAFVQPVYLNNQHVFGIRVGHDLWFAGEGVTPTKAKHTEEKRAAKK